MMTPRQIELARHALGLPNDNRRSCGNYFVVSERHADYATWCGLVAKGFARGKAMGSANNVFWLTEVGARLALKPGETLCDEDFPAGAAL